MNPAAHTEWIERPLDGHVVKVARDGSVALVYRDTELVAVLGPLVVCEGRCPALKLSEDSAVVRFEGEGVQLAITPQGQEISVSIRGEKSCEGPVVRTLGALEQGLFAGLEYLGQGERSSSNLDIETDEHIRFAPDPLKVTMPLMAFVTDRVSVAMSWDDMTLQPVYATPNFFDGTADHRMTLQGRDIAAVIRVDRSPLEQSIAWAVNRKGLPALPPAPRTAAEQNEICLAALNGPLKTQDGWGHCVQPNWARQPLADMASTVWRLSGEVPAFGRFVPGGAHVPNGTIYFVTQRGPVAGVSAAAGPQFHRTPAAGRLVSLRRRVSARTFREHRQWFVCRAGRTHAGIRLRDRRRGGVGRRCAHTGIHETLLRAPRRPDLGDSPPHARPVGVGESGVGVHARISTDGQR